MFTEIIPELNATGIFTLREPFSTLIPPQTRYTVKGVRKLSEIIASGEDPFEKYYSIVGVTKVDYDLDVVADISIVVLSSETGQWLYVPSTSIISYPDVNGVVYTSIVLAIALGPVADMDSLTPLKTSLVNVVKDALGVNSQVEEITVSPPAIVPYAQHLLIQNARDALKVTNMSDRAKYVSLLAKFDACTARVIELENYIKANMPPP
jgi:hypothetical protein